MLLSDDKYGSRGGPLKVLDIKILHGANYFSAGPVVILRLDLGEYDEVFTNQVPGFHGKLKTALPSLHEHHCSIGREGGFFERVEKGTLLGHVTEHVAIELQTLAGMDTAYGKTRSTATQGVYNVVFRFFDEEAGKLTAHAAVGFVNAILLDRLFHVNDAVDAIVAIREERMLGPSTQVVVSEAQKRGIPFQRLDEHNLVQLGTGKFQKRIRATVTSDTSLIAVETAGDRYLTARMLEDSGVPVPLTIRARRPAEAVSFRERLNVPVVVKPCAGKMGEGLSLGLETRDEIEDAVERALSFDDAVVVQPFLGGSCYRLLVIDYRFVAAARLAPPVITGDGNKTIGELVEDLNADSDRGVGDKSKLTIVEVDDATRRILGDAGFTEKTVLPAGESLALKLSKSLKLGGSSIDVTDDVHPANRLLAERASRALGLDVAGVDVVALDIEKPVSESNGAVIEVNAAPDFRMHISPVKGKSQNVAGPFLDMLFPPDRETRASVLAVTGTDGATLAARLLAHGLETAGYTVGMVCSEGLFVSGDCLIKGNMTGHGSAGKALKDRTIDCAVFEVPVETILDRGLGYEFADVGIVLNVRAAGRTFDEAATLDDIAYAKSVVAEQVYHEGYSVLNADSEAILEMSGRLYSRLVLFSRGNSNPKVREHAGSGGRAVVIDNDRFVVLEGLERIDVIGLGEVPFAAGGEDSEAVRHVVPAAVGALFSFGISIDTIRKSLLTFDP